MKIAVNSRFGGFSLSTEAKKILWDDERIYSLHLWIESRKSAWRELKNDILANFDFVTEENYEEVMDKVYSNFDNDRTNPSLIEVIEKLGSAANGRYAELRIVEIPDNSYFHVDEYDGSESVIYSESPLHFA